MKFIGYIRRQDAEEGGGTLISRTLAEDVADQYVAIYTPSEAGESSNTTTQDEEPPEMRMLRGTLSNRATSAEFNEWSAREVVAYVDRLKAALESCQNRMLHG